jgi:hypothetical protein
VARVNDQDILVFSKHDVVLLGGFRIYSTNADDMGASVIALLHSAHQYEDKMAFEVRWDMS